MNATVQLPFPRSIRRMTGSPSLTPSGEKKEGKKKEGEKRKTKWTGKVRTGKKKGRKSSPAVM